MKILNPIKWLEFKRESVIIFANLGRNNKAYKSLREYTNAVALVSYIVGMIVFAGLYSLICYLFS